MPKHNLPALFGTLAALGVIVYLIQTAPDAPEHALPVPHTVTSTSSTSDEAIPLSSGPSIGGVFNLTDHNGQPFSDQQLLGKYSLIFFGFTHCPDMCPMALQTLTDALAQINDATKQNITPVFITVDPKRDTPEVIKTYLSHFDAQFTGLTGDHAAIKEAASSYKVYYESANPEDAEYNVNHSGYIYFMSPEGKYLRHFSYDSPAADIASEIKAIVATNPLETPAAPLPVPASTGTEEDTL